MWLIGLVGLLGIIGLTFLPGFGNLGYFSSLGIAGFIALLAPHVGIELGKSHGSRWTTKDLLNLSLAPPVAITVLTALWMAINPWGAETCDWGLGFGFFLLGPALTCHLGILLGLVLSQHQRPLMAHVKGVAIILLLCIWEVIHVYQDPAVFSYSPLFGYFAGPIYDAAVPITGSYLTSRAMQCGVMWLLAALLLLQVKGKWRTLAALSMMTLLIAGLYSPPSWGLSGRQRVIDSVLDHTFTKGNVVLHARVKGKKDERKALRVLDDALSRYDELKEFFGLEPPGPVHIYMYPNTKVQRALMGAGKVRIAKPWLGQVHLSAIKERAPVLKHEMAHVFGAGLLDNWLGIPTSLGFLPQMALVEGLATSLEGRRGDRSLHQWSAALLKLEKLPKIEQMMGPSGYTSTYGPTAYTAAGSFLQYLDEFHGRAKLLNLYSGSGYEANYGTSLGILENEWRTFLTSKVSIEESVLNEARFVYDRKPVLKRRCPVVVARLQRAAAVESKKQRWNQALLLREEVCRLNPKDTASQIRKAWSLAGLNRYEESIKVLTPISRDPEETAGLRSRATHALGDILWLSGDPASAERLYTTLLNEPLTAASHRAIWIKQQTTREAKEPWARGIRNYLINTSMKGKERRKSLRDALIENPRHPLLLYLTGKLDQIRGKPSGAAESLKQAVPHLTFPLLKGEALRALGAALLHLGHPKEALEKFEEMEKTLPRNREGLIAEAIDWSRRAQYQLNTGSGSRP